MSVRRKYRSGGVSIMLTRDCQAKVMDFGMAKHFKRSRDKGPEVVSFPKPLGP
jgi:hypothetical protein